ncbi:murein biosynthesis integral membrane protein MurJ [Marmoricola sp. RAF53]|uniref:murein biosynthesis integral membrane protein MurJ n=1 Tax=Marmoricola sp. RAF53 TaxID=3233059 RepID=UPI003F955314
MTDEQEQPERPPVPRQPSVLSSSAVMAAGTVFSRMSGFVRTTLLAAALGTGLHADVFNIANTIPNMLYILLAGGVFNAVLVPQLVRALKNDEDGGAAYTNRIITLAAIFLAAVSVVLVLAAPLVMRVLLDPQFFTVTYAEQRDSIITLARYCLPQVFFYGMFVLIGQVLNSRGVFGPMMWAPIANNLVAIAVLVGYLVVYGTAEGDELCAGFSGSAAAFLGIGSTLGIVIQFLVLIPYLRRSGFRFRARYDFRGAGLGHTFRLGVWTVLFVVANQVAYTVVVRIASGGTLNGGVCDPSGSSSGTGYTIYSNSFLLVMVPHAVITVSLATAVLPRLSAFAADHDFRAVGRSVVSTMRSAYALVLPLLALLPVVAPDLANVMFGWGSASDSYSDFVPTLSLFVIGTFFFTSHYLVLRGFYALEQNKRVFGIQCVIAAVNIVAAVLLTRDISSAQTAPRLVISYTIAYAVGATLSYAQLSRRTGGLGGRSLVRFGIRMAVVVGLSVGFAWLVRTGLLEVLGGSGKVDAAVRLVLVGSAGGIAYLALARLFHLEEIGEVVGLLTARLPRGRRR